MLLKLRLYQSAKFTMLSKARVILNAQSVFMLVYSLYLQKKYNFKVKLPDITIKNS